MGVIGAMLLILVLVAVQFITYPKQSSGDKTELAGRYGFGGGGNYDESIQATWWRDWDASYNYLPGVNGRPPFKMWTVGKIDNRLDGPPASTDTGRNNIDAIFAYEKTRIAGLIKAGYTGQHWEIGNEPNWHPMFEPADYAYQFHLYCSYIKGLDPSALCLNGGITMVPDTWETWLADFIQAHRDMYGRPADIDVWSVHPYDWFDDRAGERTIQKIKDFRANQPHGPIWITEFGKPGWDPEPQENIVRYIHIVCAWLNDNHQVYGIERWFWWGVLAGGAGMGSNGLFSHSPYSPQSLTPAGQAYLANRQQIGQEVMNDLLFLPVVVR
jgi:hypothetical protein